MILEGVGGVSVFDVYYFRFYASKKNKTVFHIFLFSIDGRPTTSGKQPRGGKKKVFSFFFIHVIFF